MITEYIKAAMRKAKYEILEGNEGFYGEIPGFDGVWTNASTLEGCREELVEVLEEWILFHIADNTPLPRIKGIDLSFKKAPKPALV